MADTKPSTLDRWTKIAQIGSALSVIVGIVLAVAEIYKASSEIRESSHVARLNELPSIKEMIKEDGEVRSKALKDFGGKWDRNKIDQILAQHETVSEAYYSDDLVPVKTMGHHYEVLGALVEADVVDFRLIYEVVDFPDDFWDATEELRAKARTNWSAKVQGNSRVTTGLPDFWKNFTSLHNRYLQQRKKDEEERRKRKTP
jgi:hypothetical protein